MMKPHEVENALKRYWQVEKLEFVAQYSLSYQRNGNSRIGYFHNLSVYDRKVFYPATEGLNYDRKIRLKIDHPQNLVDGKHYLVTAKPASDNQTSNPYLLELEDAFEIEDYDTPKAFIRQWFFLKGENPGDAATIASQLKLNQLELYTQTERFIFELIQNADDMPAAEGKPVEVFIEMLSNHFLFLHNGKFFDRNDVKAIADAAQSTKAKDKTQTGYKGIGFKSVFTDSSRVYIKSGDYTFKFDKLNPVYTNFRELYRGYLEKLTPEARNKFERDYSGQEAKYTQIERIPWQIKPIWVDYMQFPDELKQSEFSKPHNVSIALEIGADTFLEKEYHRKVLNLLREPRFMLFLRNLSGLVFRSEDNNLQLRIDRAKIHLGIYVNGQIHSKYLRTDYEISISNESFGAAGLHFERREIEEGKFEFVDEQGKKIENIPEKLAILDKTVLTFAAQIDDNKIAKLPKDEAILFNYLPTSDKRFEFPFLVNGDFVTKTDREFILHENVWNQYLFFHLGFYHILWLSYVSGIRQYLTSYLNLLIPKLKDEDDQHEGKINAAFNRGVRKALTEVAFIRNELGNLSKCADVILDETKLSFILGFKFFHRFTGSPKLLPDPETSEAVLKKTFLGIDRFDVDEMCQLLQDEGKKDIWISAVKNLDDQEYDTFLKWLDELCGTHSIIKNEINTIHFLRFPSGVFSPTLALEASDKIIANDKILNLENTVQALGFEVTGFSIEKFPNLKDAIVNPDNYLANELRLYEKVVAGNLDAELTGAQKAELIVFLKELYGVGEERFASGLALFKDKSGVRRPLTKLVSGKVILPEVLESFQINEEEEVCLSAPFAKHLLQKENLFSRMFLDKTFYNEVSGKIGQDNLTTFINFIVSAYDIDTTPGKDSQSTLISIPWIFTDEIGRFKTGAEVFCPRVLQNLDEGKYHSLKLVIEEITGLILPDYQCVPLIKKFALNVGSGSITNEIKHSRVLSLEEANNLLDVLLTNEAKEALFLNWQFVAYGTGQFKLEANAGKRQCFSSNSFIAEYRGRSDLQAILIPLPAELYQLSLHTLMLLEGEALFSYIISKKLIWLGMVQYQEVFSSPENKILFLSEFPLLELNTANSYEKKSSEHKVIQMALDLVEENPELVKSFREKIRLNGETLSSNAISDEVKFKIGEVEYVLSLSEILPNYKGKSDITTSAVKSFPDLKESDLRKHIFPYHHKSYTSIEAEIRSSNPDFITPAQIIFLLLHSRTNNKADIFKGLVMYDNYFEEENANELLKGNLEFLNLAFRIHLSNWQPGFWFIGFVPENIIMNSGNILPIEALPDWVQKWLNEGDNIKKREFLKKAGVNDSDSNIVRFRKAILSKDLETCNGLLFQIENKTLLHNTLVWLHQINDDDLTTKMISIITGILKKEKDFNANLWFIPVIKSIEGDLKNYSLTQVPSKTELYNFKTSWGSETFPILDILSKEGISVIDISVPVEFRTHFSIIDQEHQISLDKEELSNAKLYDAEYYSSWVEKDKHPIFIYPGDALPWVGYLGKKVIRKFKKDEAVTDSGKYYVCQQNEHDLPYGLPHNFPSDKFRVLAELRRQHDSNRTESEEVAPETHQLYRSIVKGSLDMQIESQVAYNNFAIQNGVVYLNSHGYNFDNAFLDSWGFLCNVVHAQSSKHYRFFFRSAVRGLLFLHPEFWRELGSSENGVTTSLVVIYPGYRPKVFLNKEELLQQELNEMILARAPNSGNRYEIDQIAEQLPAGSHLIFFTSDRYKSLYEDYSERKNNTPISNRATVKDEDFLRNF